MTSMAQQVVPVKAERPDEAEIQELAAKMVEANKAKASQPAQQNRPISSLPSGPTGQVGILNFLTRKGAPANEKSKEKNDSESKTNDESSLKGHFGWATIGKGYVPYLFRQGEKYCAVRMVEVKLLNKYLSYLSQDIYSCTCIRSYYISEAESKLLNEINYKHCDQQFGREYFSPKDLVVRLSDANEFYQFLDVCYNKLLSSSNSPKDRCGFIRINGESVVPYTIRDGQKFVPLFYFEGETDNLKLKADCLEGWDLSYLKFCCKVQGIRNELFANETCAVISLNDIRSYFPPGTNFEDYWPSKVIDSQLLIASKGTTNQHAGHWTKQPPGPPPRLPQVNNNVAKVAQRRVQSMNLNNAQRLPHPAHSSMQSAVVQAMNNGWQAQAAGLVGGGQQALQSNMQQALRMAQAAQAAQHSHSAAAAASRLYQNNAAAAAAAAAANRFGQNAARQYQQAAQYQSAAMQLALANQQQPPPLVRTTTHQPLGSSIIQQSRGQVSNGRSTNLDSLSGRSLTPIPDTQTTGSHVPYKVQKALVENKMVPSINMKPYVYSELLMTIVDLKSHFFPSVSLSNCRQALDALGIELFKGNRLQMQILYESGKCASLADNLPLIQVRDVMKYMPQLKYIIAATETEPASKRARIS